MGNVQKIIDSLLKESIFDKANELTEKLLNRLDDDSINLEVGTKYEYFKDEDSEPLRVIYLGKAKQGGGKFKNEKTNNEILLSKNLIMKRIHELGKNKKTSEMGEGNKFSGALANAKKRGEDSFKVDGKTYKVESNEGYSKKQMYIAKQSKPKNKIDAKDFEVLRNNKKRSVKEDLGGMEDSHPVFGNMNLMNPSEEDKENLLKYLKRYIKRDHDVKDEYDTMRGRFFDKEDEEDEWDNFENLAENKSVMYSVALSENSYVDVTENELINMIENIIKEEQITNNVKGGGKSKGLVQYDRVHAKDEDINKKALKDIEKKMRAYVNAG
jgi:hypothetical protein